MRARLVRSFTATGLAAALMVTLGAQASAESVFVSELSFAPQDPTFDPHGTGTSIIGEVDVASQGWLDFRGRSVVETANRASLNPGTADFKFGARIALTRGVGNWNVMQKGSFSDKQWKLSIHAQGGAAQFSCRVSGSAGIVHVYTNGSVVAADGSWHQVACARVGSEVQVQLDGVVVASGSGPIGSVTSTKPYLVGSKGAGNLADPDQYLGLLDDAFVQVDTIEGSGGTPPPLNESVTATVETQPVLHPGDAADDAALWQHPTDPSQSVVIGNDKGGALDVYDMQGQLLQRIEEGFFGNVDVHTGVITGGVTRDIVAVYRAGLRLYTIDPDTRRLSNVTDSSTGSLPVPTGGEGLCLYQSQQSGGTFAFVISRAGTVAQYRLSDDDEDGLVDATRVRQWPVGSESEGCVADDELGRLYVSEEDVALWRYGAEPTDGTSNSDRVVVDRVRSAGGRLAPDIEGLTLVNNGPGAGYLIASAQAASNSSNYFAVYDRTGQNDFVKTFSVVGGAETDSCGRTDGIAAWAGNLGSNFPQGAFVCQDNANTAPGTTGNQNFKMVPLERVVSLSPVGNRAPRAVLDVVNCLQLTCTFDASRSSDPDGDDLVFTWDFGDGTSAEGVSTTHEFPAFGTYTVGLEARDPEDAIGSAVQEVEVSLPPLAAIAFQGAFGVGVNSTSASPRVPASTQPGDTLLLAVSANRVDVTVQAPNGWQSLGRQVDETMQTRVWTKVAQVGDANSIVRVTASKTTKLVAQILSYTGTDPIAPVATAISATEPAKTAAHRTPVVSTGSDSWLVSLWANKSSATSGWTAPPEVIARQYQGTSSTGRVTALAADSGGPIGAISAGGYTAIASQSGSMATMWSIVLTPG